MHRPSTSPPTSASEAGLNPLERLREAIAEAAHLLPAQGPISVFVHHNTLHAFQHLPFHEALATAGAEFETEGYLSEAEYRAAYQRGRIDADDLDAALDEWLALQPPAGGHDEHDQASGPLSMRALARMALVYELPVESEASLRWRIVEHGALERFRADVPAETRTELLARTTAWLRQRAAAGELAKLVPEPPLRPLERDPEAWALHALWAVCRTVSSRREDSHQRAILDRVPHERSHRDLLRAMTGEDPAALVNPFLIRFCAAYLDQGMAAWPMPERSRGFLACFRTLLGTGVGPLPRALAHVPGMLAEQERRGMSAEDVILDALGQLGVPPEHYSAYLTRVLLQLPGWAGMIYRLECFPQECDPAIAPPSLVEYLAVRLTCDLSALAHAARYTAGYDGALSGLVDYLRGPMYRHAHGHAASERPDAPAADEAAFRLLSVCQLAGLAPEDVWAMSPHERQAIIDQLDDFDELTRRRIWHEAFERHYRTEILQALQVRRRAAAAKPSAKPAEPARFQVWFCIDDREESLRRQLEELRPDIETFGVAGFFGLAIDYVGLERPEPASLCPVAVSPGHEVHELPHAEDAPLHERWQARRGRWARLAHLAQDSSRSLVSGALLTPLLGLFATFPMATRVLFPRLAERLRAEAARVLLPAPRTVLTGARHESDTDIETRTGKPRGFLLQEQVDRIAATLENMGIIRGFAPMIAILGHGSISVNNPHKSAYDCGACGGRHGGPNARLFADLANRPEVRQKLRDRGIDIPDHTIFIGGLHNTCSDAVELYDTERIPAERQAELADLRAALEQARKLNAHERCRRFEAAPVAISPEQALRHVEARASDLSQVRPEFCHATNAACIVGRRALTRGLFLDRRAFLVSYDPSTDPHGSILERILAAVGPVGAGINLEYYFSRIDNDRYGCGTKLPHNITALLGVMDGHASDLRTGLSWEMVEIHEPMRLLTVVESTPEILLGIADRQPGVRELVVGGWMQLACIHPEDSRTWYFVPGRGFEPFEPRVSELPSVRSSVDWYRGYQDFRSPALIEPSLAIQAQGSSGVQAHVR